MYSIEALMLQIDEPISKVPPKIYFHSLIQVNFLQVNEIYKNCL